MLRGGWPSGRLLRMRMRSMGRRVWWSAGAKTWRRLDQSDVPNTTHYDWGMLGQDSSNPGQTTSTEGGAVAYRTLDSWWPVGVPRSPGVPYTPLYFSTTPDSLSYHATTACSHSKRRSLTPHPRCRHPIHLSTSYSSIHPVSRSSIHSPVPSPSPLSLLFPLRTFLLSLFSPFAVCRSFVHLT